MATGHHFDRSSNNSNFGADLISTNDIISSSSTVPTALNVDDHEQCFESHFKDKYAEKLESSNDNKIRWFGTFDEIKVFVADLLNESGKWSSPGGKSKVYRSDKITITWYSDRHTLLFQGKLGANTKQYVCDLVNRHGLCVANGQASGGEAVSQLITELELSKVVEEAVQNKRPEPQSLNDGQSTCKCSCSSIDLFEVIEDIKLDIEILKTRADALQAFASTQEFVSPVEDSYGKQVERLERELANEKGKTEKLEAELLALKLSYSTKIHNLNDDSITSLYTNNHPVEVFAAQPVSTNQLPPFSPVNEVNGFDGSGPLTLLPKDNTHCLSDEIALSTTCRSGTNLHMNKKPNYNRVDLVKLSEVKHLSQAAIHSHVNKDPTVLKRVKPGQEIRLPNHNRGGQVNFQPPKWMGNLPLIELPMAKASGINSTQVSPPTH